MPTVSPDPLFAQGNILIDEHYHARLADFGLLNFVSDPANATASNSTANTGGTIRWMSPELLHPERFGFKDCRPTKGSDYYALGMVILEVLSGQAPFARYREVVVMRKVLDGEGPERPESTWFTDELWGILENCWSSQPKDRPTGETILESLERASLATAGIPSASRKTIPQPTGKLVQGHFTGNSKKVCRASLLFKFWC